MYFTVSEAAHRLKISPHRLYCWIRNGTLPAECVDRIGMNRRTIRIRSAALERYLRAANPAGK